MVFKKCNCYAVVQLVNGNAYRVIWLYRGYKFGGKGGYCRRCDKEYNREKFFHNGLIF